MIHLKLLIYLILLITILFLYSCNNKVNKTLENNNLAYSEIKKADWLIGEWQNITAKGISSEIWIKQNDSTYFGNSSFVIGGDTISSETITLEQRGKKLFYLPIVKDQNEGLPIKFTLTKSTNTELIFENPEHDFPQKITYNKITNDSLVAEISGNVNVEFQSQKFPLSRKK